VYTTSTHTTNYFYYYNW